MGALAVAGQALGGIYGAFQEDQAAIDQGKQIINESERAALQKKNDVAAFAADQEGAYLKSGVILDGSPLLVLEKTRKEGLAEVNNIREVARGQAASLANNGRNKLFGSILGGAMSVGGAALGSGAKTTPAAQGYTPAARGQYRMP